MKTINLEQILKKHIGEYSKSPISPLVIEAMRDACNQTVEMCAGTAYYEYQLPAWIADMEEILKVKTKIK